MTIQLGVLIASTHGADPDHRAGAPADASAAVARLAAAAESHHLDLIVVAPGDAAPAAIAALDPWSLAAWIAAGTDRIAIGVEPSHASRGTRGSAFGIAGGVPDAETPVPAVLDRARESLRRLAPGRLIDGDGSVGSAGDAGARADVAGQAWVVATPAADAAELAALAEDGVPVVVPVASVEDVERVASVAAEMRAALPARPRRSAEVRARRVARIDYDGVPDSLAATAVEPGDRAHRSVASTYLRGGAPGLVLRPTTPAEVADALAFARRHRDVPLGIRSAGHGISGRSTNRGGIVIDVGGMDEIVVLDRASRLVRIGPGATWKRVAAALHPYGWALGSGDYGGVGVGGLATAGGIGLLSRAHGLTIDHLRAVELVLADGTIVRASADEHPDLFWAVRGAGANFGVATAFEFEVDAIDDVGWAQLALVNRDLEGALLEFGRIATEAPRDTTAFLVTGPPREGQSVMQLFAIVDDPDPDVVVERLTPFTGIGALVQQQAAVMPYRDVMAQAADVGPDGQHGFGEPVSRSAFLPRLTPGFARDAAALLETGLVHFFELRTMGGAVADVASDAMAFPHRSPAFQVTAMGADDAALDAAWDRLRHHFEGLYLSFETDRRPERLVDAFTEPVLERLRTLKGRYDPDALFRDNFAIEPRTGAASAATDARSTTQTTELEIAS
ncbi:FAD-binding oxidoreductase [Agromyces sp. GXS1127]|uniref:FAD-binding oxidoreductase n=1 Tax=Agromyces sp. GXS1127 TaxID=3424181 RepID=UPI003D3174C8